MAIKKRTWSYTATGATTGSIEVGLGAAWGRILELTIDDNASTEAAVGFVVTDDRGVVNFTADTVDISEGPFHKGIGQSYGDLTDDNPVVGPGSLAKSPVTISHTGGANLDVYSGYLLVEV